MSSENCDRGADIGGPTALQATLAREQRAAREQLTAAWQLHVNRVEEALESGWREHIEGVFEERFEALAASFARQFEEAAQAEAARRADSVRQQGAALAAEELTQAARRIRLAENERELWPLLCEAAGRYAGRVILLSVDGSRLRVVTTTGIQDALSSTGLPSLQIDRGEAPALDSAIDSIDSVITLAIAAELSMPLAAALGESSTRKAYVVPVAVRRDVRALLCADEEGHPVDLGALELLSHLAAGALAQLAQPVETPAPVPASPDRDFELRARRRAQVRVAEMQLFQANRVSAGRSQKDLYSQLKEDIDKARREFRQEFLADDSGMTDYLHAELVRTLANDDAELLGPTYPGPLV